MTEMIKRLEKKGFVTCTPSTSDRRYKKINCTERSRNLYLELAQADEAITEPICAGLSAEEKAELIRFTDCMLDNIGYHQRQIVKDFLIKFTKNLQKRCQKHCMAPDTSFDRLHFSVQQVFAEIRVVWQLVDI